MTEEMERELKRLAEPLGLFISKYFDLESKIEVTVYGAEVFRGEGRIDINETHDCEEFMSEDEKAKLQDENQRILDTLVYPVSLGGVQCQ